MYLKTSFFTTLKIYFKLVALILGINLIFEILLVLFDPTTVSYFFIWNPFVSSFIHSNWSHLGYNLIALLLFLIPSINHSLGLKGLLFYATLIAFISLPFVVMQLTQPIVGISGLFYFLMTRFVFGLSKYKTPVRIVFVLLIIGELILLGNNDNISHFCHLIGVGLATIVHLKSPKQIQQANIVS